MTPEAHLTQHLTQHLADRVGPESAARLVAAMRRTTAWPETAATVVDLLGELHEASSKVHQAALDALPELERRGGLEAVVPWLDLGIAIAGSSGAAGLKYFRESPVVMGVLETRDRRRAVLGVALELADGDPNVALELFRQGPELLTAIDPAELSGWGEIGLDLARWDYVLGIEFLRHCPKVARVLPLEQIRDWVAFGMKLVTQNSLGKTDYMATLEFFRTSPTILGDMEEAEARRLVIHLAATLADRSPRHAVQMLAEAPAALRRLPSAPWRRKVLRYGGLVAERDADTTLAYLRRCPEVLALVGETDAGAEKFEDWFRTGMEVLEYSPDGARAYFALETQKALASLEQAMSGVSLRQVARSVKLFVEGLCGAEVAIEALPDSFEPGKEPPRPRVSPDGRTLALPSMLRRYPVREDNVRLYTVMAAHEAGHLEFGTYRLALDRLDDLVATVKSRYGIDAKDVPVAIRTLNDLFQLYPQPLLMRDLWALLEDARIEHRLRYEYPGLAGDLAELATRAMSLRTLSHGMSARELVVDALLKLTTLDPDRAQVPDAIADVVGEIWPVCQPALTPMATAEDVVRVADRVYALMDDLLARFTPPKEEGAPQDEATGDLGTGPQASDRQSTEYRPAVTWSFRGDMDPERVTRRSEPEDPEDQEDREAGKDPAGDDPPSAPDVPVGREPAASGLAPDAASRHPSGPEEQEPLAAGRDPGSPIARLLAVGPEGHRPVPAASAGERVFLYPEWDGLIQDYRTRWCRVVERPAPEGELDFSADTVAAHGPAVRLLRRYFESLRPPGLRRVPGQADGEDLDVDALIRRRVDRVAGAEPSDRIYTRREKRERDVAAAFLVDLSGSTSRQVGGEGRRVIDVEKEGLVLLSEALDAIGDYYAVYGYSGQGRGQVDFLIVKEFEEPADGRARFRLGAVEPMQQNRDGAAIRHATQKLLTQGARTKLLVLLSDGRPLDDGYADEYALEDTKAALREARMRGIHPFCITVDQQADHYLCRMYGEVRFLIIDHAGALPERLPRMYQRLTA